MRSPRRGPHRRARGPLERAAAGGASTRLHSPSVCRRRRAGPLAAPVGGGESLHRWLVDDGTKAGGLDVRLLFGVVAPVARRSFGLVPDGAQDPPADALDA